VEGAFARGDAVIVRGPDGREIGRASSPTTPRTRRKSAARPRDDILLILGIEGRSEMVHRDDLVLGHA